MCMLPSHWFIRPCTVALWLSLIVHRYLWVPLLFGAIFITGIPLLFWGILFYHKKKGVTLTPPHAPPHFQSSILIGGFRFVG